MPTFPTLPQLTVDTTYSEPTGGVTHNPNTSAELVTLLTGGTLDGNTLQLGDVVMLDVGTTYTGLFTLPNITTQRGGTSNAWIYFRSGTLASLPAFGTRVAVADASNMAKIRTTTNNTPSLITNNTAHNYRFTGIEFSNESASSALAVIQIGNGETSLATLPHDIIFDRCYIHGSVGNGARRGVAMDGTGIAVTECYVSEVWEAGADSQACWAFNTNGPLLIHNSYLEGAGENVMFGGADPDIANAVPADITMTRNHFFKPLSWINTTRTLKNLLEFKNAERVEVKGNIFENCWAEDQAGFAVLVTPRNQDNTATWSRTVDITFHYNKLLNVSQGFAIAGHDTDLIITTKTNRLWFNHNLLTVDSLVGPPEDHRMTQMTNGNPSPAAGPDNVTFTHNTFLILTSEDSHHGFHEMLGVDADALYYQDNIASNGAFGWSGTGTGDGTATLNGHFDNYTFTNNALIEGISGNYTAPATGNFFPANVAAVDFVNYAGGNYRLASTSPHKAGAAQDATDGTDLGADIDAIEAAIAGTGGGSAIASILMPQIAL